MRKNEAVWIESRMRWQINVQQDGERKTFIDKTPGTKGKVSCERKADNWLDDRLINENIRVEKMLDRWYEKLQISTSISHYRQYDGYIRNWIKPAIGTKRMRNLTKSDLQRVIDAAYKNNNLSKKTLQNIRSCLTAFVKYCRNSKVTKLYPEELTIPLSARHSVKTIANPKEFNILFEKSDTIYRGKPVEDRYIHAYRFCFLTGLRPGELLGLRNENIDGSKIKIVQSVNDYGQITAGKNKNARRVYKMDYHAEKILEDQRAMLKRLGQISPYVFPDLDLGFITQDRFRRAWKRYCAAHGINTATTPYEMRHTFVSINDEMPEALKKLIVGHSKNMDTEGTYGHERADTMEKAADYMSKSYAKILGW
jgi:integrase